MCRLLGYAAPGPTSTTEVVGPGNTFRFQNMSHVHSDGWGTAWVAEQERGKAQVRAHRRGPMDGIDPDLDSVLQVAPTRARLVHLRLATASFALAEQNSHPFHADGIAFAHNGTIVPVQGLHDLLEPQYRASVKGDTDSELYFALVRQNAEARGSLLAGVVDTVLMLHEVFPDASLNAMILTPAELLAVRASSAARVPPSLFADRGLALHEIPPGHGDDYYAMSMRRSEDGTTVFSSTGIDLAGWSEIPDNTVSHIDLATLQLTQVPILLPGTSLPEPVRVPERPTASRSSAVADRQLANAG